MDQSKTLHRLTEHASQVEMIELLLSQESCGNLSPGALNGIRITLRSVREGLLSAHDAMASQLLRQARIEQEGPAVTPSATPPLGESMLKRRTMASSIEKMS